MNFFRRIKQWWTIKADYDYPYLVDYLTEHGVNCDQDITQDEFNRMLIHFLRFDNAYMKQPFFENIMKEFQRCGLITCKGDKVIVNIEP